MKRTPLRRKSAIKRGTPKRTDTAKKTTKHARRERDWDRMAWCATLPCALTGWTPAAMAFWVSILWKGRSIGPCDGRTEVHHAGPRAGWRRAADDAVIPLCSKHHRQRTDLAGPFSGWERGTLMEWETAVIEQYRAEWRAIQAASGAEEAP